MNTPEAGYVEYPSMLGLPAPRLRAYPKETIIAEKLDAMVQLGMANSRMKDFCDVWIMSRELEFDGKTLSRAIQATFRRRGREVPRVIPTAFTEEFSANPEKGQQWTAFLSRNRLDAGGMALPHVIRQIHLFLMEPLMAASEGQEFDKSWPLGGTWVTKRAAAENL